MVVETLHPDKVTQKKVHLSYVTVVTNRIMFNSYIAGPPASQLLHITFSSVFVYFLLDTDSDLGWYVVLFDLDSNR